MFRKSILSGVLLVGGLVGMAVGPAGAVNLVGNGDFETGAFAPWTISDSTSITINAIAAGSGSFDASLGSSGKLGTMSQTLATVAGASYVVSFLLQNQDSTLGGGGVDLLNVSFGAATIFNSTGVLNGSGYNPYSFFVTATSNSTTLTVSEQNDLSVWNIDNISVVTSGTGVPEPGSAALMGAALLLGTMVMRRRQRAD